MEAVLPIIWFFLIGFTFLLFVILDGADLGLGVLSLIASQNARAIMMGSIGPLWYANETWLVIAGATLFGAFPLAYSIILSALYIPVMMVLFGLVFRAISIEFMAHDVRRYLWEVVFGWGSLLAIVGQGFILGGLLSGIKTENGVFAGGPWDWFNLVSLLIAAGLVAGYTTLGASYMLKKVEGEAQSTSRRLLRINSSTALVFLVAVSIILPLFMVPVHPNWVQSWHIYAVPIFLLLGVILFIALIFNQFLGKNENTPYTIGVMAFIFTAAAVVAGIYPYFIPFSLSISDAVASGPTLVFMLFGVAAILPLIVVYNLYVRGVFKGKVYSDRTDDSY
jgi:cytochrome bd ubiquinol oxidase subunit II